MSNEPYDWLGEARKALLGRTITKVQYMSKDDAECNYWWKRPLIIQFDDGSFIIPMSDDEGNEGGALWSSVKGLETIPVM